MLNNLLPAKKQPEGSAEVVGSDEVDEDIEEDNLY